MEMRCRLRSATDSTGTDAFSMPMISGGQLHPASARTRSTRTAGREREVAWMICLSTELVSRSRSRRQRCGSSKGVPLGQAREFSRAACLVTLPPGKLREVRCRISCHWHVSTCLQRRTPMSRWTASGSQPGVRNLRPVWGSDRHLATNETGVEHASVSFFSDSDALSLEQDPLLLEAHAGRNVSRDLWFSADAYWNLGGSTARLGGESRGGQHSQDGCGSGPARREGRAGDARHRADRVGTRGQADDGWGVRFSVAQVR